MPTLAVKKRLLDEFLGKSYSEKELDELCFDYGLEVDDIVNEKNDAGVEEEVFKIEIPANRYDLLCVEGLTRALKIFKKEMDTPKYEIVKPKKMERLVVKPETKDVRGVLVAAVLRGISFNKDSYASFIDLQDKLHQNICRRRTLVSMGTHDLDTIKGPFEYRAEEPEKIKFKPLNQTVEMNGAELMEFYQNDLHLREFLPIIRDKPLYPVIYDSNGIVCSLPPIINGDHSKITLNTKNVLIEVTATDLKKAKIVLDTVVIMFSQYCNKKFSVEAVQVENADGQVVVYPELSYRQQTVEVKNINTKIGLNLTAEEMADLLEKMSLECKIDSKNADKIDVTIPPSRHDILHECDIAEDIGLAFGFNNIERKVPEAHTVAQPFPLNKLTEQLRSNVVAAGWTEVLNFALCSTEDRKVPEAHTVAQPFPLNKLTEQLRSNVVAAGWTEVLNFALCSTEDVSSKMRKADQLQNVVKISNPKTIEFQVARNALIPGLLKTLSYNKDMPLPLKIFEIQDIIIKDTSTDTNSRNERHLAALFYSKTGGFEIIHGFLDRIMELLDYHFKKTVGKGYFIKEHDDPSYFPGRCAQVLINGPTSKDKPIIIGTFGILHPEVVTNFALTMPCSALELNLEMYLDALLVIGIAFLTAALGEGLTYLMVYRTDEYKRLTNLMERKTKQVEKRKGTAESAAATKADKKKLEREEDQLKGANKAMSMFKMKSVFAIGITFTALLNVFSSMFEGHVVAKLPFYPISLIQSISHRNLIGNDYTDCNFVFLYILCTMTIRQNMQKFLGFAPSRAVARQNQGNPFASR
uniref:Phenylalanine--tRNA ligase beta subunit n=1 Tax=Panagrolaimus sp. JU765 TaxID=591449 RepID=A0AC34QG87_9BILA